MKDCMLFKENMKEIWLKYRQKLINQIEEE